MDPAAAELAATGPAGRAAHPRRHLQDRWAAYRAKAPRPQGRKVQRLQPAQRNFPMPAPECRCRDRRRHRIPVRRTMTPVRRTMDSWFRRGRLHRAQRHRPGRREASMAVPHRALPALGPRDRTPLGRRGGSAYRSAAARAAHDPRSGHDARRPSASAGRQGHVVVHRRGRALRIPRRGRPHADRSHRIPRVRSPQRADCRASVHGSGRAALLFCGVCRSTCAGTRQTDRQSPRYSIRSHRDNPAEFHPTSGYPPPAARAAWRSDAAGPAR
ncbi:hypothetical protein DFR68_102676 [Nocardia mexicana]|uniref:Uncharacterized protein n=1 Tax=Nocardia mexicana TaxID=279262 RepID=A0A370HC88_9NOCA|nr:hypothetical protein DFR68_102676 [Nocardia mexicana]